MNKFSGMHVLVGAGGRVGQLQFAFGDRHFARGFELGMSPEAVAANLHAIARDIEQAAFVDRDPAPPILGSGFAVRIVAALRSVDDPVRLTMHPDHWKEITGDLPAAAAMKFLDETFLKFNGVPVVQQLSAPLPFVTTRRGDNVIVQRS